MAHNNILLESGTNELEIVEFYIEEEAAGGKTYTGYYGVNVAKVLEIIRSPAVTALPSIPHPSVLGAFNLRSKIIPLVDLSIWLGKQMVRRDDAKVIVSEFNRVTTAFLVSGVTRIHRLSWEQVEPPSRHVAQFSGNSITGVVRIDSRIVLLLDMERIVGDLSPKLVMREDQSATLHASPEADYKALVVDDSNSIRSLISKTLAKAGFAVEQDINGRDAWDRLLDLKARAAAESVPVSDFVDVIVSDIEMPVMDGHSLTRRIKEDPVLRAIPVILFSSLITDSLRHKGEAVGADDQVSKPEITALTNKAMALIEASRKQAA